MEQYKELIKKRLSPTRFEHSICVAKEAIRLSHKYGADKKKAELAGLLHDIMKDTNPDEQLQFLKECGITLTKTERSATKLWHAISGAAYLEFVLGIKDRDILNAVRYHTTARAGMSLLEKIVFIADFTSADRNYDGVEEIRNAASESLEKVMIEGIAFTIGDLIKRRLPIHEDTFSAYNALLLENTVQSKQ